MIPAVTKYRSGVVNSTALLHFDGTNGSTTFTDVYTSTWSAVSGAALSTTSPKFGTASLLLNGSSDFIKTTNNIFGPGSGDFTFECFFKSSNNSGSRVLFGSQNSGAFNGVLCFVNGGQLYMLCGSGGGSWLVAITGGTTVSTGTWYHAAFVRYGNRFDCYLDGVSQSNVTTAGTIINNSSGIAIGSADPLGASSPFAGNIDDARIWIGGARYTANFTPPAAAFTF